MIEIVDRNVGEWIYVEKSETFPPEDPSCSEVGSAPSAVTLSTRRAERRDSAITAELT